MHWTKGTFVSPQNKWSAGHRHAKVKGRFKGRDFRDFYWLSKVYLKQRERWPVIASKTARLGD